ncbi:DsbE family thiol:disulfide interchange protein [Geminicoccus harenae]|uniref:DsbE family thiol:disulfide interchange protein n=1 Tax=Geminicoccus harenae TaxID=2498453 RepID=UPI002106B5B4|nr:DsbE family thiol:disulfide interchange protein [Geminicoccus harenae]
MSTSEQPRGVDAPSPMPPADTPAMAQASAMRTRARGGWRWLAFLPLVLMLVLGGVFWLNMGKNPAELPSALVGKPVPDFDLPPLPGRTDGLAAADLRDGQPKLVNVFASWCVPCRIEHPVLMDLQRQGISVVGINYKDEPAKALAFIDQLGDPYARIGADRDGRAAIDWGVYGVPETFVIDREGRIVLRFPGPLSPEIVRDRILPALAGGEE